MRYILVFLLSSIAIGEGLEAQFTLTKDKQVLEIGGAFSTYYNYRFYPNTATSYQKNRFRLRDAQLRVEYRHYKHWEARLDVDFAGLIPDADEDAPTTNPLLNDAYITYKAPFGIDFNLGYQKVMFSRGSMTPIFRSAFIDRPALTDGRLFHRRDIGLSASGSWFKQRLNVYAGVFNGLGIVSRNNDPGGSVSWMARADFSYPARFRYNELDLLQVPIPMFSIGGGIYGADKRTDLVIDRTFILGVNGLKISYGLDAAFQFKGLSVQAEWLHSRATPIDTSSSLLESKPTNFVQMGGFLVSVNYYIKKIKTAFCLRYDELNPNDLKQGNTQRSLAISGIYFIKGQDLAIRAEYHHRFDAENTGMPWKRSDLRLTMQYLIW